MRITVHSDGRRFFIPFPTGLIANRLTARIAAKHLKKSGVDLSAKDMHRFLKVLKQCRKALNGEPLVEVKDTDGTYVKITI